MGEVVYLRTDRTPGYLAHVFSYNGREHFVDKDLADLNGLTSPDSPDFMRFARDEIKGAVNV